MTKNSRILNPWFAILTEPRATIQQVIDINPRRFVLLLATMVGVHTGIGMKLGLGAPETNTDIDTLVLVGVVIGAIISIATLYISGSLLRWLGSKCGGKATSVQLRAVVAWSLIPFLCCGVLGFGTALLVGPVSKHMQLTWVSISAVGAIWSFVLLTKFLQQIQGFSVWNALNNALSLTCLNWFVGKLLDWVI